MAGKPFATQWTVYGGEVSPGLHELLFFLELDPTAIGQGGALIMQRSRLTFDDLLRPLRYRTQVRGTGVALELDDKEVTVHLPDGSVQRVPRGGAEFVIEANLTGEQALMLAVAHAQGRLAGEARFTCFVVNSLLPTPYRTTPAPDLGPGWLRSSHEEELRLEDSGLLAELRMPTQAITIARLDPPPPLPDWHDAATPDSDRPRYVPPADRSFRLEEVTIPGAVTPIGGTLTLPAGSAPFPTVLFLAGSGAHDRNGIAGEIDLGTHEILDFLAEKGFAGLRYDTRGTGSTKIGADLLEQGLDSIIADARACLSYLRGRPEVDARRLVLIGHSQGGTVALVLAKEEGKHIDGMVLMASIGRPIDEVLIDQTRAHGEVLGLPAAVIDKQIEELEQYVELARSDKPWVEGEIPDHLFSGGRSRYWFRELLAIDALKLIAEIEAPVLIMQGDKDFQVSPEKDAVRLYQAAQAAHRQVTLRRFPDLDHLFKPAEGESTIVQYYDRTRRVDRRFLESLAAWLGGERG